MVKVTTTEGLELILENEFPCVLNHISEPKIEMKPNLNGEITTNIETTVDKILYSKEKINFEINEPVNVETMYDIIESPDYIITELLGEHIDFYAYNID